MQQPGDNEKVILHINPAHHFNRHTREGTFLVIGFPLSRRSAQSHTQTNCLVLIHGTINTYVAYIMHYTISRILVIITLRRARAQLKHRSVSVFFYEII